jgi:hypothetical protein
MIHSRWRQSWAVCYLPTLPRSSARTYPDHSSLFWLIGNSRLGEISLNTAVIFRDFEPRSEAPFASAETTAPEHPAAVNESGIIDNGQWRKDDSADKYEQSSTPSEDVEHSLWWCVTAQVRQLNALYSWVVCYLSDISNMVVNSYARDKFTDYTKQD